MSNLVDALVRDHLAICDMLDSVSKSGVGSKEGQTKLFAVKQSLLDHLKKEDMDLYPVLRKAAETDNQLKQTLDTFAQDMGQVSAFALDFLNKYSQGDSGLSFAKDFGRFFTTLKTRIRKEETILYKEYDRVAGKYK